MAISSDVRLDAGPNGWLVRSARRDNDYCRTCER
jgi:hypothetical protein